jgi:putative membrane protein
VNGTCDMEMGGMEMGGMMLGMAIWGLLGLALLALAIVATVWLARRMNATGDPSPARESPEDILRRRYAAGELDEDEYLSRRAGLRE